MTVRDKTKAMEEEVWSVPSEKILINDEMVISRNRVRITKIVINKFDDMVFDFVILDSKIKKRSRMTLIVPKKLKMWVYRTVD